MVLKYRLDARNDRQLFRRRYMQSVDQLRRRCCKQGTASRVVRPTGDLVREQRAPLEGQLELSG